jgi:hypothetical protein
LQTIKLGLMIWSGFSWSPPAGKHDGGRQQQRSAMQIAD